MNANHLRPALLALVFLSGCGLFGKKPDQAVVRPVSHEPGAGSSEGRPKMLAIANGNTGRDAPLADPVPPPPPDLIIADLPGAAPKDTAIVAQPKPMGAGLADTVVPAAGIAPLINEPPLLAQTSPKPPVEQPKPPAVAAETPLQVIKRLQQLAAEKLARLEGFEAVLTRRETIAGKPSPEQVMQYRLRTRPQSMHMKWIGLEGKGRELVFVGGRKEDVVEILTAKGDGFALTPAGKRISFAPTDSSIRSQSRYDLREGGMQMGVTNLGLLLAKADRDPKVVANLRYLGLVNRLERQSGLEAVEETIQPNVEPLFPKGGKRTLFFDPEPSSPGYGLPILVTASNELGREVEYYFFDQLKPARFSDADFDTNILWKK